MITTSGGDRTELGTGMHDVDTVEEMAILNLGGSHHLAWQNQASTVGSFPCKQTVLMKGWAMVEPVLEPSTVAIERKELKK